MRMFGFFLIILSYAKWAIIPFVHLFSVSGAWKAAIYASLLAGAEIVFWCGSIIVGVESARRMRKVPSFILWLKGRRTKEALGTGADEKDTIRNRPA